VGGSSGYTVLVSPVGARVATLSPHRTTVYAERQPDYVSNGVLYGASASGVSYGASASGVFWGAIGGSFAVAAAAPGARVQALPTGATKASVGCSPSCVYGGTYLQPFHSGSQGVYQVAAPAAG